MQISRIVAVSAVTERRLGMRQQQPGRAKPDQHSHDLLRHECHEHDGKRRRIARC